MILPSPVLNQAAKLVLRMFYASSLCFELIMPLSSVEGNPYIDDIAEEGSDECVFHC